MCGIVGIFGHPEASTLAYLSLYALQHRGQESAGIVTADGDRFHRHAGMGHAADVFSKDELDRLPGTSAIGHVRYSTAGDSNSSNAQPFLLRHHRGPISLAHNGNLVNAAMIRDELESDGSIFQTTHRDDPAPGGPLASARRRGCAGRCAAQHARRLLAGDPGAGPVDRRA